MQVNREVSVKKVAVLGTGGTIAGRAQSVTDEIGYTAGVVPVADLLAGLSLPAGLVAEHEQVAQTDSKDMTLAIWQRLGQRVAHHLARQEVAGVVITHGTDTLEETAWFLQQVLAPVKPVVLTCAMRPATALMPDGPQNLSDALRVAADERIGGVVVVCAGRLHAAQDVTKVHTWRLDAFGSGDAGPLGVIEAGELRLFRQSVPGRADPGLWARVQGVRALPRVELVFSHADAQGHLVRSLLAAPGGDIPPLRGLVVAGTGNGTVHTALAEALEEAQAQGVVVWRGTRCALGRPVTSGRSGGDWPLAEPSVIKARLSLALALL
ncbi:MAG TPA: asparaginase [Comamonadaceae bacterium]|nr:asparaginase [Comamonadaceae bacterium]